MRITRCDGCQADIDLYADTQPIRVEQPKDRTRQSFDIFDFCCWPHLAAFAAERATR